jgi:hypothetical protein
MSRALLVVAAVLTVVAAVVVARAGELMGGRDGASSTGLLASEVRLAPEIIGGPTAQDVPAVKILGDAVDCPPSGAGSEDTQQRFEQLGSAIGVTGMLSSFDAVSVVVNGPGGEVTATLAADFELRGDLSPGSVVDLEGTAEDGAISAHRLQSSCADAGVVDCATGDDPHFELRIEGTSFKVTGRLDSITSQQLRILGPGLIVELSRHARTQVDGGLGAGDPVMVEGNVQDGGQLHALVVALRCEGSPAATPAPSPGPSAQTIRTEPAEAGQVCERSRARRALRLDVDDGDAEIKRGQVLSVDSNSLTVDTPRGPINVLAHEDTEVRGDFESAAEVRVRGELLRDGSLVAEELRVLCSAEEQQDEGGEDDEGDEEDKSEDDDGDGNDRGAGRSPGDEDEDDD